MKDNIISSVLMCKSLQTILEQCSLFVNNPLVIISETFDIIAFANDKIVNDDIWNDAMNRGYITLEFGSTLNKWSTPDNHGGKYDAITFEMINENRRRFYKIKVNNQFIGYLNILESYQNLDKVSDDDYDFIVQVLAKELSIHQINHNEGSDERFIM